MNRFYRALLGGELLPPQQLRQMLGDPTGPERYGLGIQEIALPSGLVLWGHNGSFLGYETWATITADARRQLTLSLNPLRTPDGGNPFEAILDFIQTAVSV